MIKHHHSNFLLSFLSDLEKLPSFIKRKALEIVQGNLFYHKVITMLKEEIELLYYIPIHSIRTNWYHQTGDIDISTFRLETNCTIRLTDRKKEGRK